jgi:hypothetical protein
VRADGSERKEESTTIQEGVKYLSFVSSPDGGVRLTSSEPDIDFQAFTISSLVKVKSHELERAFQSSQWTSDSDNSGFDIHIH